MQSQHQHRQRHVLLAYHRAEAQHIEPRKAPALQRQHREEQEADGQHLRVEIKEVHVLERGVEKVCARDRQRHPAAQHAAPGEEVQRQRAESERRCLEEQQRR